MGGVCKEQGQILRGIVNHEYYTFQIHEDELQSSILGRVHFIDLLNLTKLRLVVCTIVIRVQPKK